jgi:hypothetical protein
MAKPNMITEEELNMVKLAVMLPIIMSTLEHDITKMKEAGLKTPTVYVANLKRMQGYVMDDIKTVKRDMRNRGIKISEEGKTTNGYKAKYLCRGYNHELIIGQNILKSLVVIRLAEMMEIPIEQCVE